MWLDTKTKKLLRRYEFALFSTEYDRKTKIYILYLLLQFSFGWTKDNLLEYLEKDEINSELYLLVAKLYDKYDRKRSSIVPYIEHHLPWMLSKLVKQLKQQKYDGNHRLLQEDDIVLDVKDNEYYLKNSTILTESNWLGKYLRQDQKYLIYKILHCDDDQLTQKNLAQICNVEKQTIRTYLSDIGSILGGTND